MVVRALRASLPKAHASYFVLWCGKAKTNASASLTNRRGEGALCYSCSGAGALGVAPMSIAWANLYPRLLRPPWLLLCVARRGPPIPIPHPLRPQTLLHSRIYAISIKALFIIQICLNPPPPGGRSINLCIGRCVVDYLLGMLHIHIHTTHTNVDNKIAFFPLF